MSDKKETAEVAEPPVDKEQLSESSKDEHGLDSYLKISDKKETTEVVEPPVAKELNESSKDEHELDTYLKMSDKKETTEVAVPPVDAKELSDSSEDEHIHDHKGKGHDHPHDHDDHEGKVHDDPHNHDDHEGKAHDHPHIHDDHTGHKHEGHEHEGENDGSQKSNRGEQQLKKAMLKMGLKPVTGITRVTIQKGKTLLLYIDDPEVLKSPGGADNSYIIFGEAKINDLAPNLANPESSKFKADKPQVHDTSGVTNPSPSSVVTVQEDISEEGLNPEDIAMVIEHCKCSQIDAIKALRSVDSHTAVDAILKLN